MSIIPTLHVRIHFDTMMIANDTAPRSIDEPLKDMFVTRFDGDDDAYHRWMLDHPHGYVLNTKRGEVNRAGMLHRSGCAHIRVMRNSTQSTGFTHGSGIKICSTSLNALLNYLTKAKLAATIKVLRCRSCDSIPADLTYERLAEEIPLAMTGSGHSVQLEVNAYEQDPLAKSLCIQEHGTRCKVCDVDLERQYGLLGVGAVHVHFLPTLSTLDGSFILDAGKDLVPVCPTCHSMLHRGRDEPLRIEDLKRIMAQARISWHQAMMNGY